MSHVMVSSIVTWNKCSPKKVRMLATLQFLLLPQKCKLPGGGWGGVIWNSLHRGLIKMSYVIQYGGLLSKVLVYGILIYDTFLEN